MQSCYLTGTDKVKNVLIMVSMVPLCSQRPPPAGSLVVFCGPLPTKSLFVLDGPPSSLRPAFDPTASPPHTVHQPLVPLYSGPSAYMPGGASEGPLTAWEVRHTTPPPEPRTIGPLSILCLCRRLSPPSTSGASGRRASSHSRRDPWLAACHSRGLATVCSASCR